MLQHFASGLAALCGRSWLETWSGLACLLPQRDALTAETARWQAESCPRVRQTTANGASASALPCSCFGRVTPASAPVWQAGGDKRETASLAPNSCPARKSLAAAMH